VLTAFFASLRIAFSALTVNKMRSALNGAWDRHWCSAVIAYDRRGFRGEAQGYRAIASMGSNLLTELRRPAMLDGTSQLGSETVPDING